MRGREEFPRLFSLLITIMGFSVFFSSSQSSTFYHYDFFKKSYIVSTTASAVSGSACKW